MKNISRSFLDTVNVLRQVFRSVRYSLLALTVSFLVFALMNWLPNLGLILHSIGSARLSFLEKAYFLLSSLGMLNANANSVNVFFALSIAFFTGINAALLFYYFARKKELLPASGGAGALGMIGGLLGIGCASCGSVMLSLVGLSGAAVVLPFRGEEFSVLGLALLLFSMYVTASRIRRAGVCAV